MGFLSKVFGSAVDFITGDGGDFVKDTFSNATSAISSGGSDLWSAGANLTGSILQNSTAKKLAKDNNAMSIELANTAHQREVRDLKAAGLNPILSAGGNGAATPQMQSYDVKNIAEPAVSSALKARQITGTLKNLEADTKLKEENTKVAQETQNLVREQAQKTIADYWKTDAEKHYIYANTATAKAMARIQQVEADMQEFGGAWLKFAPSATGSAKALGDLAKMVFTKGKK